MSNRTEKSKVVIKAWGREEILINGDLYCCKRLIVNPGYQCSVHRHLSKDETFVIESGYGWCIVNDRAVELLVGSIVEIPPRTWHSFWCPAGEEFPLVMLEVSTHHDDADVERRSKSGPLIEPLRCPAPEEAPSG